MSAFDFRILRQLFGGQADARAGSLTGDLSQRDKALIARLVQSTSPGLTPNASGSIGEQVQYLINNPGGAALAPLAILGKAFPFTNGTVTDLTINGSDQTVAPTNGVLRYRTLTFTTAHTLRITSSPCILMVDTLTWNAAGVIACEASGAPALGADPAENFPRGGRSLSTGDAIGGYGGGFLIVLATTVNGSTTGTIRANGTAGSKNTTSAAANFGRGGEGALSSRMSWLNYGPSTQFLNPEAWTGGAVGTTGQTTGPALPAHMLLANGGDSAAGTGYQGVGGGSGGSSSTLGQAGGGSGVGGGGGANYVATAPAVAAALETPALDQILALRLAGCRGGGGGGSGLHTTGANNCAGGGGGGCVVLIVDNETQVSTLTAAGGAGASGGTGVGAAGGAGVTLRQVV